MYRIVKTGCLDMAHRISGHKGKCRFLHGHTWKVELSLSADELDEMNMVVDFSELKSKFFVPIDKAFDHSCILGGCDQSITDTDERSSSPLDQVEEALDVDTLNIQFLPFHIVTAERLAQYFYEIARTSFAGDRVHVDYVRVFEQLHPNESYAEYRE